LTESDGELLASYVQTYFGVPFVNLIANYRSIRTHRIVVILLEYRSS